MHCIAGCRACRIRNPVAVNFFGTPIISLLLLPAVAAPYSVALTKVLWIAGTLSHAGLCLVDRKPMDERAATDGARYARLDDSHRRKLNISIAGVTLDLPGAQAVSAFGLAMGLFVAGPLFTLILSRLIFEEPMQRPLRWERLPSASRPILVS